MMVDEKLRMIEGVEVSTIDMIRTAPWNMAVARLERLLEQQREDAVQRIAALEAALEFYADQRNYDDALAPGHWEAGEEDGGIGDTFVPDDGKRARSVLRGEGGEK